MITFIFICVVSSFIAGLGIGGGSLFIILCNFFNLINMKEALGYNLLMFIIVGIFATINNIKVKKFDKIIFFKTIFFVILGSYIGSYLNKIMNEQDLKFYFNIFIFLIGIYEIISSLLSLKKGKI